MNNPKKLTVGELDRFVEEAHNSRALYRYGKTELVKGLLASLMPSERKAIWNSDDDVLRMLFMPYWSGDEVPEGPAFFTWIVSDLFAFEELPRDSVLQLYDDAATDLGEIESNLNHCTKMKNEFASGTTEGDRAKLKFYEHFIAENQAAKEEIVHALAHLYERPVTRHRRLGFFGILGVSQNDRWSYRWVKSALDAKSYEPLRHAFLDLSLSKMKAMLDLANTDKDKFVEAVGAHIRQTSTLDAVRTAIDTHHGIARRAEVLGPALDAYQRGEVALFSSTVATQIEGIFEDACYELGVEEKELHQATLVPKVAAFHKRASSQHFDFVYFSFFFPTLRNHVAHGRMIDGKEREHVADLLMLDLAYVCSLVTNTYSPDQALRLYLNELVGSRYERHDHKITSEELIQFACLFVDAKGRPPDAFYRLDSEFAMIKDELFDPAFAETLQKIVRANRDWSNTHSPTLEAGIRRLAMGLLLLDSANKARWRELLATIGKISDVESSWADVVLEARRHL